MPVSEKSDHRLSSCLLYQLDHFARGTKARFVACSPDVSKLAIAGKPRIADSESPGLTSPPGDNSVIKLFNITPPCKLVDYTLPSSTSTLGLAWSAPSVLVHLSSEGSLRIIVVTPQSPPMLLATTQAHIPVTGVHVKGCVAVSHNGSLLATSAGPTLKLWHLRNKGLSQMRWAVTFLTLFQESQS
jgi:hypothetical protein